MNRKSIGSLLESTVLFEVRAYTANSRMKYRMDYTACSICFLFGNNVKTLTCTSGYERFVLFSQKWHQHFHLEYQSLKMYIISLSKYIAVPCAFEHWNFWSFAFQCVWVILYEENFWSVEIEIMASIWKPISPGESVV